MVVFYSKMRKLVPDTELTLTARTKIYIIFANVCKTKSDFIPKNTLHSVFVFETYENVCNDFVYPDEAKV